MKEDELSCKSFFSNSNFFNPQLLNEEGDFYIPGGSSSSLVFDISNFSNGRFQNENNFINSRIIASDENNQLIKKSIDNKSTSLPENNNKTEKKQKFLTYKRRSPRINKEFEPNKRIHSWDDIDNNKRKLQVHFLTFLIDCANDIINAVFINEKYNIKFFQICHSSKIKVFNRKKLLKLKYKDIFPFPISDKNKGNIDNKKDNLDNYLFCCNKSSLLKEFFNKSYLEVFEEYYFQNKRVINLNGLDILLSEKTGTFNNLLNKGNNSSIKHVFLLIINELYFKIDEKNINDK